MIPVPPKSISKPAIKLYSLTFLLILLALFTVACAPMADISTVNAAPEMPRTEPAEVAVQSIQAAEDDEAVYLPTIISDNETTPPATVTFPVVDTGQTACYGENGGQITCPSSGSLSGQDAQYTTNSPSYTDNGDGTITDNVTGLMWAQNPGDKVTWSEAFTLADSSTLAGYDDWRVPTITELYSLIDFSGVTGMDESSSIPYIDTNYFIFEYGDTSAGERMIDAQFWSSTEYVSTTMNGSATTFGVNFADGRIKGYGRSNPNGGEMTQFIRLVRGDTGYGDNDFVDNGNGAITDNATGLMWQQADDGAGRNWADSLAYCANLSLGGYDDWRLPDAKELQGIVDYTRSPDTTNSPAIDPIFSTSSIIDGNGDTNYPFFWTSTTHLDGPSAGSYAVYVAFGEAQGYMSFGGGSVELMDVHGAGAQRSDPKTGDPADYPEGHGPQGDVVAIYNYSRCVRSGDWEASSGELTNNNQLGTVNSQLGTDAGQQPSDGQVPNGNTQTGQAPNGGPQIDLASAAAELGVSEQALQAALGQPPPNFEAAAQQLGVTAEALIDALGIPAGGPPSGGQPGGQQQP